MRDASLLEAKKICIIKADRIGDIVLLSGYLRFLAEALADATIDLHIAPDMIDLGALLHPRLSVQALPFSRHLETTDHDLATWLWDIDHREYDHLLIPRFTLGEPDVLVLRYLNIEHRHGFANFENPIPEDWLTLRLGPAKRDMEQGLVGPEVDPWTNEVEKYAALARWQGFDVDVAQVEPILYIEGEPITSAPNRAGLLVWPGASAALKRWPVAHFRTLIEAMDRKGEPVTVGGTPSEEPIVDELVQELGRLSPNKWICDVENMAQTVVRLARYRAVIANDTGVAHIAAAVGCRVVSISPAVHEGRFTVRGNRSTTVFADVPCRRCKGDCIFDADVWPCLTEIQPEEVARRIDLSRRPPTKLTVSAATFESDPASLLASVASKHASATIHRQREQAQLHLSRLVADDLRRRAEERLEELKRERDEIESRIEGLMSQFDPLGGERAGMQKRLAELEQQARDAHALRGKLESADKDLASKQQRLSDSNRRIEELLAEKKETQRRGNDLLAQLDRLSDAFVRIGDHADQLASQRDSLSAARSEDQQKLAALASELEELAQDKERLEREFDQLVAGSSQLSSRINEMETELSRAEQTIRTRLRELERLRARRAIAVQRLRLLRQKERETKAWSNSILNTGYQPAPGRHTWLGPPAPASDTPRISIVTPSYNAARFIEETITSVLAQNYPDFEHIIVDSASNDGTIDILARYPHLRWIVEKDRGQAHAINRGLLASTGEIVAYLNSDDVYRPGAFQAVAAYFRDNPDCMVLVGDCDLINEEGVPVGHWQAKAGRWVDRVRYWGWEKTHCIPQQSLFFRRELLTRIGLFDANLHMVMDLDMWLRATRDYDLGVINQTLAAFRLVEGTKTISRTHEMYVEQLNICRRHARDLPLSARLLTKIGVRRHFADMMLKMSEHYIFNIEKRRLPLGLLVHGVRQWPLLLLNPRTYLTAGQCLTRKTRLWPAVAQPHRAYLSLLWRLRRLRGNGSAGD